MSSAYNITKQPLNEEPNLLKSSKYKANRNDDNSEPYLTPKLISNTDEHTNANIKVEAVYPTLLNPLKGTLKPQSSGSIYCNTVIGTLAVDGWAVAIV